MGILGTKYSKSRLVQHFRNRGAPGKTCGPFEDLAFEIQKSLQSEGQLEKNEFPVIGYFASQLSWTLLTTKRLIWAVDGRRQALKIRDLAAARLSLSHLAEVGNKMQAYLIEIETQEQQNLLVQAEPGAPYMGFLNVLKLISR